ncbi:nitroreductase family protein [Lentisphaerota bacterium WC36G]|nr:nitroreductase family protein [Lentisphaerae bacterium WC36]
MYDFKVNENKCILCGLCAQDCPVHCIKINNYPEMENEDCIKCLHCMAICPVSAIAINGCAPEQCTPIKDNFPSPEQMEILIKGRRSIRSYKDENIPKEQLKKLLDIAWHAPTGVNSQQVLFTVMDKKKATSMLKDDIYKMLDTHLATQEMAENDYVMQFFAKAVEGYKEHGADMIFRGAPHFIIASAPKDTPCPTADTHIALTYFELMAQTMNIGTVWNGFIMHLIKTFPELKARLNIPENHIIGYTMAFGMPNVKYTRTVERGSAKVNFIK